MSRLCCCERVRGCAPQRECVVELSDWLLKMCVDGGCSRGWLRLLSFKNRFVQALPVSQPLGQPLLPRFRRADQTANGSARRRRSPRSRDDTRKKANRCAHGDREAANTGDRRSWTAVMRRATQPALQAGERPKGGGFAGCWSMKFVWRRCFVSKRKKKGTKLVQRAISKARQDSENGELEEMRRGEMGEEGEGGNQWRHARMCTRRHSFVQRWCGREGMRRD